MGGFGGADADEAEEGDAEGADGDAACERDVGVEGGEEQWPGDDDDEGTDADADPAASAAWEPLSPKMEPKRTVTPAVPLPVLLEVVKMLRNSTPRPRIQVKTVPMTTSSA